MKFKYVENVVILVSYISNQFTTSMDEKGRITIPSKICKFEGFKEGQKFTFLKTEDGYTLVPLLTEQQMQEDLIDSKILSKSFENAHKIDIELEK